MFKYTDKIKKEKAFVILSTQRAGSSLVCRDILGAHKFGRPEEFFVEILKNEGDEDLIDIFFAECQPEHSEYFSIKLMCNYLHGFGKFVLNDDTTSVSAVDCRKAAIHFFKDNFQEANFVYIRRRPSADQAFSRVMARVQGVWHVQNDGSKMIDIPCEDTIREIESSGFLYTMFDFTARIESENAILESLLQETSTEYYSLDYKEVVQHYPNYIMNLCSDFGQPYSGNLPERNLRKVITDRDDLERLAQFKSIVGENSISDLCLSGDFEGFSPTQFLQASMFFRLYQDFEKAISCGIASLDQGFEALLNLANIYFEVLKDYINAEKYYKLAANSSSFSHPHHRLSLIYDQQEKLDKAIEEINVAIELYNDNPGYYHHLAHLLGKHGDAQGAKQAQEKAAELEPSVLAPYTSWII